MNLVFLWKIILFNSFPELTSIQIICAFQILSWSKRLQICTKNCGLQCLGCIIADAKSQNHLTKENRKENRICTEVYVCQKLWTPKQQWIEDGCDEPRITNDKSTNANDDK